MICPRLCPAVLCLGLLSIGLGRGQSPSVIINEIHYAEDDPTVHSEFIELHNPGATAVDLGGWFFDDGVPYAFPAGSTLEPGGYLIVCEDPATVQAKWGAAEVGVYNWNQGVAPPVFGRLRNSGRTITLRSPGGTKQDEVDYALGFPWPTVGDPPNYSIELIHPSLDNSLGGNWRASNGQATSQAPIVYVPAGSSGWKYRKALSEPSNPTDAWRFPGFPANDGTWLTTPGGAPFGYGDPADTALNDMRNPPSSPGYTGIYARHTFAFAGSAPGPITLRVWNDDGFIAWLNGAEVARFGPAQGVFVPYTGTAGRSHEGYNQPPDAITLTAPNALLVQGTNVLCLHGLNQNLGGSTDFYLDAELGFSGGSVGGGPTPRSQNSVFATIAPPCLRQVEHTPVAAAPLPEWPKPGQAVRITTRVTDPQGVASVTLSYAVVDPGDYIARDDPRYEAAASWTTVPMSDDGLAGDLAAADAIFSAIIPGSVQTHRRLVRYRLTATDTTGASVRTPYPDDPQPNFAYFVYGTVPAYTGRATPSAANVTYPSSLLTTLPVYHLITTVTDHSNAMVVPIPRADGTTQNPTGSQYGHSLYNWKGALCYDGHVYDHIRYRARGGVWRFSMGKNMWKFDFNKGHDFAARDNYGKKYGQPWRKLNFSACIQQGDFNHRGEQGLFESVGFRLFQLSGLPAEHTQFLHFRIVEHPDETNGTLSQFDDDFQGLYLAIEQQDGQFLDEHDLPDGNLYKMEGGTGELNNQGPTQPKNKSDLVAFQSYGTNEQWWRTNCDLPNYYNYRVIVDAIHHYDIGDGKNYFFYHNPVTSRWMALPWDLDLTWADNMYRGDPGIAGLPPSGNSTEPFFSRIVGDGSTTGIAPLRMEWRNRVREVLDLLFTPEQTGLLIDEMASFIYRPGQAGLADADRAMWDYNPILISSYINSSKAGHGRFYQSGVDNPATPQSEAGTFAGMVQKMKNYVGTRRSVMATQLLTAADENLIPTTPTVTRSGSGPIPTNALSFSSSAFTGKNGATFAAMKWRIAEVTDPAAPGFLPYDHTSRRAYEIEGAWESAELTAFSAGLTIPASAARPGGTYRVRVKHKDSTGRWSHWSAPVQFMALEPDVSVYVDSLVVSQFLYNPAPPTSVEAAISPDAEDYEWIELMNVGTATLALAPVRFTKGIDFDFAGSAVTSLAPGARVVVVKHLAAFNARYAVRFPGVPIAGEWQGGDSLSNGGEQIKLSFGAGTAIRDFTYDDAGPWPDGADGTGYGLVLVNPATRPDHAIAANWRLSRLQAGSPGQSDSLSYASWALGFGNVPPDADTDGDGYSNRAEFALASLPLSTSSVPSISASTALFAGAHYLTLNVKHRLGADQVIAAVELSSNLIAWDGRTEVIQLVSSQPNGDGTATMTYRSQTPVEIQGREFIRLRLTGP